MTLLDLAERCEKATGPDRSLDFLIDLAIQGLPAVTDEKAAEFAALIADLGEQLERYTASLDAAMTLVPEGLVFNVMTDFGLPGRARLWGSVLPGQVSDRGSDAATPALALCAAALRTRSTQEGDTHDGTK